VNECMAGGERIPVLTFLTNFLIGGTERQVVNLLRDIDRARFDVQLACFQRLGPLLEEVAADVALTEYPITTLPSPRTLWQQARLARHVRARGIRIVHSYGLYPNLFAIPAARLAGAELVVASIRDTGDHLTRLQNALQKWACRAADHVLVNALAVKTLLARQGYDAARISVIPNGIDVSQFRPRGSALELRRELGLPAQAPVVAVVSRLNRLKGVEYFLEAAAHVARRFGEARFLIVGDSLSAAYRDELKAGALRLGLADRAVFTGFRNDISELLSDVSASVLPSLSEGLSNVVLESMAAGVPVVATSVGGTPEMLEHGVTGLLVPPRDAAALADAISSLLADPSRAASMGRAARQCVVERFSLEAMVRETERLYLRLLEQSRGHSTARRSEAARAGGVPIAAEPSEWR